MRREDVLGLTRVQDVFRDQEEKHRLFREAGYQIVSNWECDWKQERSVRVVEEEILAEEAETNSQRGCITSIADPTVDGQRGSARRPRIVEPGLE